MDCCGAEAALRDDDALNASSGSPSMNGTSSSLCRSRSDSMNYHNHFQFHTCEVCLSQKNPNLSCTSFILVHEHVWKLNSVTLSAAVAKI